MSELLKHIFRSIGLMPENWYKVRLILEVRSKESSKILFGKALFFKVYKEYFAQLKIADS